MIISNILPNFANVISATNIISITISFYQYG